MGYDIDFLPVGNGLRSGDAIALRFGDLHGLRHQQLVVVIDGGTKDSGAEIVNLIRKHYATNQVDLVISTHPDADHASGLTVVLEEMEVQRLWMHLPWEHAEDIRALFRSGQITDTSLRESLKRALQNAHDLYELAIANGIPVEEPFSDSNLPFQDVGLRILSPSRAFYRALLPHFRETPAARQQLTGFQRLGAALTEAVRWAAESVGIETLKDPELFATSAENNTSVILLLTNEERHCLFTGDAGVEALSIAAHQAEQAGIALPTLKVVQIPHHGSRHNVGPTVLDRILGPRSQPQQTRFAVVSAAKDGAPKHPSRKVTNAFHRRGAWNSVYGTQGTSLHIGHNAPPRAGIPAVPIPFHDKVEEDEEGNAKEANT